MGQNQWSLEPQKAIVEQFVEADVAADFLHRSIRWVMQAARDGDQLSLKHMTFGDLVNHYLNHELPSKSKSTRKTNKMYISNWIDPAWHGFLANEMKTMEVESWLHSIHRPDGTKLKVKGIMSAIFSHGVRWEFVDHNPICGQGGTPGHRGASTGSGRAAISIQRVILPRRSCRRFWGNSSARDALVIVDAVTALGHRS